MIENRVALDRRDDPRGNADDEREQDRAQRKLDRRGEERDELVQDGRLRDHRLAEIAVQHARDVDAVLHEHRLVEPVLLQERLVAHRIDAALAGHRLDRIARHQADEEKGEQRHADERGHDE
jgi:hypothetical protein